MADVTYHAAGTPKARTLIGRIKNALKRFYRHVIEARQAEANRQVAAYLRSYSAQDAERFQVSREDLPF